MAFAEVDELRKVLSYDPDTGLLTWDVSVTARGMSGKTAGTRKSDGHIQVHYKGRKYLAHRIAWALANGAWPVGVIDHINGSPADNRLINLRDTMQAINAQNTVGATGAWLNPANGRYRVRITAYGRRRYIGTFDTPEDAQRAYLEAKREMHPESRLNILERN
jgi:hypothetical protein